MSTKTRALAFFASLSVLAACSGTEFGSQSGKKSSGGGNVDGDGATDNDQNNESDSQQPDGGNSGNDDQDGDGSLGGDGDSDHCVAVPAGGKPTASAQSGGKFRTTYFHESVAVDQGKTNNDPSTSFGFTPYPISANDKLAETKFKVSASMLKKIIKDGTDEIEYFAFAHQFGQGLDKIALKLETKNKTLSDVSTTNIYSAYGYVSIKNMVIKDGVPHGDVDLFSFNYNPSGATPLDKKLRSTSPSAQDATGIVGPASEQTTAKVSEKGVKLDGFKLTITISADLYDSVQYRAIRANLWDSEKAPSDIERCDD